MDKKVYLIRSRMGDERMLITGDCLEKEMQGLDPMEYEMFYWDCEYSHFGPIETEPDKDGPTISAWIFGAAMVVIFCSALYILMGLVHGFSFYFWR